MRRLFQIAILAAGLDYISKMLILNVVQLPLVGRIEVFPPFLNFHMAWNYGVNFGLFAHDSPWTRWVLIAIAVGVSVFHRLLGMEGTLWPMGAGVCRVADWWGAWQCL